MARNGSGNYSVPNTFTAGASITAAGHNENWADIGAEITNSVAADGQTTMTGQLKAASGSLGVPSLSFGTDTDTGCYRKSANTMSDVCGGAEVVETSPAGINVTGVISQNSIPVTAFPSGTLMLFQQTAAPTGWTKQTTHNDKALRVVSGTPSSGGTSPFSTVFGLTATSGHTLILSELPGTVEAAGGASAGPTSTTPNRFTLPIANIGPFDQPHTHPIELRVQYVDLIIAAKN